MCGIAGIYGLEGIADPHAAIRAMTDRIAHRGPDSEGSFTVDNVIFGHRRLSVIDPAHGSDQPFTSEDGNHTLIFNGEIYNYRELRSELEELGHTFRTNGDTEVLLASYVQWKEKCLHRLHGMFAFAVHDRVASKLFLARDRIGIKPLYFHHGDRHFLFASELRAILASGLVERKLDRTAFIDHLRYATVHAPRTMVRDIQMLLPGHHLTLSHEEVQIVRWWDVNENADRKVGHLAVDQVYSGIRERFFRAVERRLVADVPFGAFLSGGIDSSAVVGCMAQLMDRPVRTFSVVFDEQEFSEEEYSTAIAQRFKTDHTVLRLRSNDLLHSLPEIFSAMDHPSGDGANTWMISRATRSAGVTVALSGLGGDELFAGYSHYQSSVNLYNRFNEIPSFAKELVSIGTKGLYKSNLLRNIYKGNLEHKVAALHELVNARHLGAFYESYLANQADMELDSLLLNSNNHKNGKLLKEDMSGLMLKDLQHYLPDDLLVKMDRATMYNSIEGREPFLDHRLVEMAAQVPLSLKYKDGQSKWILKEILSEYVPKEYFIRPKKGFSIPIFKWFSEHMDHLFEIYLAPDKIRSTGLFNEKEIEREYKKYQWNKRHGKESNIEKMWRLLSFMMWWEKWNKGN